MPDKPLRFSTDTLLFDTVFTSLGSISKRVKVYNGNSSDILIEKIEVAGGPQSPFKAIINGFEGSILNNELLLSEDSLSVFVDVTINPLDQNLPYIVQDSLLFHINGKIQKVDLVAWGQDAHFLNDSILACNSIWTADRPYVIFNSILVDTLCTLTIDPGAKIYSHKGSSIYVKGTLKSLGTDQDRILWTNDRLDDYYINAPGQWGGMVILEGSKNNEFSFTDIRNALVGIRQGSPDNDTIPEVILRQVRIENMSGYGLLAFTSDTYAENTLINNCGISAIANLAGGNYQYLNCTIANMPLELFREGPSVVWSDNIILADNSLLEGDLSVRMINSIIWGSLKDELLTSVTGNNTVIFDVRNNLFRTENLGWEINNLLNQNPFFISPETYDFSVESTSPAINAGIDLGISIDLKGNPRDLSPDLGAIEYLF